MIEVNKHHLWWQRREFESYSLSSQIRNNDKSIQLMDVTLHNELHANVAPIRPPGASLARVVLQNILDLPTRYTALDGAKSLLESLHDTDGQYLSDHLNRQIPYLELSARALKQRHIA